MCISKDVLLMRINDFIQAFLFIYHQLQASSLKVKVEG